MRFSFGSVALLGAYASAAFDANWGQPVDSSIPAADLASNAQKWWIGPFSGFSGYKAGGQLSYKLDDEEEGKSAEEKEMVIYLQSIVNVEMASDIGTDELQEMLCINDMEKSLSDSSADQDMVCMM